MRSSLLIRAAILRKCHEAPPHTRVTKRRLVFASLARVTLSGAQPAINVVQLFFQEGWWVLWLELILACNFLDF